MARRVRKARRASACRLGGHQISTGTPIGLITDDTDRGGWACVPCIVAAQRARSHAGPRTLGSQSIGSPRPTPPGRLPGPPRSCPLITQPATRSPRKFLTAAGHPVRPQRRKLMLLPARRAQPHARREMLRHPRRRLHRQHQLNHVLGDFPVQAPHTPIPGQFRRCQRAGEPAIDPPLPVPRADPRHRSGS